MLKIDNIKLDVQQIEAWQELKQIADTLNSEAKDVGAFEKLKQFFDFRANSKLQQTNSLGRKFSGIYIEGRVGRGKTMLMEEFYHLIKIPKKMVHFQSFMAKLHRDIHNKQSAENAADIMLVNLAKDIKKHAQLLCIDELEIKDITDAMLIMNLTNELIKLGVFIVFTTNTKAKDLYNHGIGRESFLPFIDIIEQTFKQISLTQSQDYRKSLQVHSANFPRIFMPDPGGERIKQAINKVTLNAKKNDNFSLLILGRKVDFTSVWQKDGEYILISDYAELIEQNFGYNDYIEICQKFSVIFLRNIPQIAQNHSDQITRLINFIDNIYYYKTLLFISSDYRIEQVYEGNKGEFNRLISRLSELDSHKYLKNSKSAIDLM